MTNQYTTTKVNKAFVNIAYTVDERSPDAPTRLDVCGIMGQRKELKENGDLEFTFHDGSSFSFTKRALRQMGRPEGKKVAPVPTREHDAIRIIRKYDHNQEMLTDIKKKETTGVNLIETPTGSIYVARMPDASYIVFDPNTFHILEVHAPKTSIAEGFFRALQLEKTCGQNGWNTVKKVNEYVAEHGGATFLSSEEYSCTGVLFHDGSELIMGYSNVNGGVEVTAKEFNEIEAKYPYNPYF